MTGKLSSVGSSASLELIKKVVCGNIMLDHIFHAYYFFLVDSSSRNTESSLESCLILHV